MIYWVASSSLSEESRSSLAATASSMGTWMGKETAAPSREQSADIDKSTGCKPAPRKLLIILSASVESLAVRILAKTVVLITSCHACHQVSPRCQRPGWINGKRTDELRCLFLNYKSLESFGKRQECPIPFLLFINQYFKTARNHSSALSSAATRPTCRRFVLRRAQVDFVCFWIQRHGASAAFGCQRLRYR